MLVYTFFQVKKQYKDVTEGYVVRTLTTYSLHKEVGVGPLGTGEFVELW